MTGDEGAGLLPSGRGGGAWPVKDHQWPKPGEHLWGPWMHRTGLPKPTQYRTCVHPTCTAVDNREAPKA